jgi:hypothetical protein
MPCPATKRAAVLLIETDSISVIGPMDGLFALFDAFLPDFFGDAFDLLGGDIQLAQRLERGAPLGERGELRSRIDDCFQYLRAVVALVNPQRSGLREKKLPGTWGSNVWARSSGRCRLESARPWVR